MNQIILWHGGRNLESDYKTFKKSSKGRWEHGPGLYLTTHYDRARDYAKGGGKTYLVTVEEGNDLDKTTIDISHVNQFVSKNVIKNKQKDILDDLYNHMNRVKTSPNIGANILVNLIINYDAISSTKTHLLNEFLVENGVDYGRSSYGGRDETIMVVYNLAKIKKVKIMSAKDVSLDQYELPFLFHDLNATNKPKL